MVVHLAAFFSGYRDVEALQNDSPRNIIRVNHEASRTHAWRVTLQRHNDIVVKTFSDSIYGMKRKALKTAMAYRDELLHQYSPYTHAIWVRTRLRRNNTSGIPGVGRYEERANPHTGYTRVFWLASWVNEHGDSRKRRFTVSHYGERQAKPFAVAERARQLNLVLSLRVDTYDAQPGGQPNRPTHGGGDPHYP